MHIAFDARFINDDYHGIGRYAYHLLEAMTRLFPQQRFTLVYNPALRNTRFPLGELAQRANVALQSTRAPLYLPPEQVALPWLMWRLQADVWHTPFLSVPLAAPCPVVSTIHDLIFFYHPEFVSRRGFLWYYTGSARLSVWRSARLIAVSQATAEEIASLFPRAASRVAVIPEGAAPRFRPRTLSSEQAGALRARYHLPERFILSVGARRPSKNLGRLVRAFARLAHQTPHHLVLAGPADPHFEDEAMQAVQECGLQERVHFPGFIAEEDLPLLYNLADVFAFPSLAEGFGLPPLEAMASGTAVLVSCIPALQEVSGGAVPCVDPLSEDDLTTALRKLLLDAAYRADVARRGLERARALSWENAARKTMQVYLSLEA
ncbi:MAG: glycosyltransferase family 1 protein [Anaerolineae bacterium]|nr:MAG: glycosyltransferase family 1 protein [Anaerolineae bacterium]